MEREKYNELLSKIDSLVYADGEFYSPVSPTSPPTRVGLTSTPGFYITSDMDIGSLSLNEKLLLHTLLHKFFSTGNRRMNKKDIKKLHDKLTKQMKHEKFDRLDE